MPVPLLASPSAVTGDSARQEEISGGAGPEVEIITPNGTEGPDFKAGPKKKRQLVFLALTLYRGAERPMMMPNVAAVD